MPIASKRGRGRSTAVASPFRRSGGFRCTSFVASTASSSTPSSSPAVFTRRCSIGRSISPGRSFRNQVVQRCTAKRTCLCSPTTHPGSFRCALHKNTGRGAAMHNRLNMRRSAMIGTVQGDLAKRALIRPSSHQQRRRSDFHPRPSRLSMMSNAVEV